MREFLNTYGLWAAFVFALIENDVAFIAIGVVARLGDDNPITPDLNPFAAVAVAIVGALIHDSAWFYAGHFASEKIKATRVYRRIGPTIERWAQRFGPWEMFFARFVYGTRNPSSMFWGIQRLPWTKFASIEALALTLWGSLLATIGFHSTAWAIRLLGRVEHKHRTHFVLTAIAITLIVVLILAFINRRGLVKHQKKVEARALDAEERKTEVTSDRS